MPETFFTVWNNLIERGRLRRGETVLIHGGTSGIGLTAIQLAKHSARPSSPPRAAREDRVLPQGGRRPRDQLPHTRFRRRGARITGKRGVDVVLDMVGGDYIEKNLRSLALEGRLVIIAFLHGSKVELDWRHIMLRRLTVTGSTLRASPAARKVELAQALRHNVWPLLDRGQVKTVVHRVFPLAEAAAAHALMNRARTSASSSSTYATRDPSTMFDFLTSEPGNAIPIAPVTAATLPAWLETHPQSRDWISTIGFKADPGTFAFLPGAQGRPATVLATPAEGAPVYAFAGLPMALPEGRYALELANGDAATDAALGWALGAYSFNAYKAPKRPPAALVWPKHADRAEVERLARSVFLARDMINTPAEDMGPAHIADAAAAIASAHGATLEVIVGDDLLQQGYPTIHIVGRASHRPPRLIDLRWGDPAAPKVTLVGKGVCFDTGGLDLKTREGMLEMKKDMGGAAVTLGLAAAIMAAGAPIRLRLLIPAVENSVGGNAYRPRDIVRTRSGKTVEIGNTDAEGRLILCDALAEADRERPDLLVDCATLTGAARIALGPELQALVLRRRRGGGRHRKGRSRGWRSPVADAHPALVPQAPRQQVRGSQQCRAGVACRLDHRRTVSRRVRGGGNTLGASRHHGIQPGVEARPAGRRRGDGPARALHLLARALPLSGFAQ